MTGSWGRRTQGAALTLVSAVRALRLTCLRGSGRRRYTAELFDFSDQTPRQIKAARADPRSIITLPDDPFSDWEDAFFSFRLQPRGARTRLTARLTDGRGRQLLLDGELIRPFKQAPELCLSGFRADWNGEEILFPPAGTAAWLKAADPGEEPGAFGLCPAETGIKAGFAQDRDGAKLYPGGKPLEVDELDFQPLSAEYAAGGGKNAHVLQFGQWRLAGDTGKPAMLGMKSRRD